MDDPVLRLKIPALPDRLQGLREEVARHGARLGMAPGRVGDLKTIATEACANAVRHAYEDEDGTVEVSVAPHATDEVEIVVRDFGSGIFPRPDADLPSLKMGLPIIGALSRSFCLISRRGDGTTLTAHVPVD